jgi:hypothetical protein
MKESDIRSFLDGDVDATWLLRALEQDAAATQLIVDLEEAMCLTPEEMRRLCDAHLAGGFPVDGLQAVAGLILESDNFGWDEGTPEGELVAEILWDWAMPEDEAPPTTEAVQACRQRLASL